MNRSIKNIFLTGLVVVIPAGLTLYILFFLIDIMDRLLLIIPQRYQPDTLLHVHIPGLGLIFTIILIFISGLVAKSYFGNRIVRMGENLVDKIPFIRSIYQAIKRIADSLLMDRKGSFKKVVLVEYPCKGMYSVGFVTGVANEEVQARIGRQSTAVFLPLALTPTAGFFFFVPDEELVYLDMTVEEAFTLIISAGIVTPQNHIRKTMKELAT
ncbi:MAG: DUF502 domain-containing protein [Deltaproteobacteria bacterium]|nr:DUF502 domain-containing protein [Deltaproteobacteria bacterium]